MTLQPERDVIDVIARINYSFKGIGLDPPTVILLSSHEQGMQFLLALRQDANMVYAVPDPTGKLGSPVEMADGSIWMEVEVLAIKVRWPANRLVMPGGSWSYV